MIFFAGKAEQPVARRKGRDVCLIHLADREGAGDALVAALHGGRVLSIEGAALLVDHDAVRAQRVEAVAVKLAGEQPLRRAERVGGIHDDEVVLFLALADEFQRVLVINVYAAVVHAAGIAGQIGTAGFDDLRVHLHKVDALHAVVAGQFPHYTAVACADNKNVLGVFVYRHRHMGNHLVVDELVALGQHDVAVPLLGVKLAVDPDAVLDIRGVKFRKPHFHTANLPVKPAHSGAECPGPRGRSCCSPWPWHTRYNPRSAR